MSFSAQAMVCKSIIFVCFFLLKNLKLNESACPKALSPGWNTLLSLGNSQLGKT